MEWQTDNPLARYDEPSAAHTALCDYAALGPGRSLSALVEGYRSSTQPAPKPPTRQLTRLKQWSIAYAWQERVAAYDAQQAAARLVESQRQWAHRETAFREATWKAAEAGIARVRELLEQTAISTTTTETHEADEQGRRVRVVTIREAPKGTLRDIAALLKAVNDVGRLTLGQPTAHTQLDIKIPTAEELADMTPEELDQLESQLGSLLKP